VLAAHNGRSGHAYFVTDGEPVPFRAFMTDLAATAGVALGDRSVPRSVAWATAGWLERAWRALPLPGEPPLTRTALALGAQEMTVDDTKARRELDYEPTVSRDQGLAALSRLNRE
jgi:nucleoside-diphosphate-sugar epimerase